MHLDLDGKGEQGGAKRRSAVDVDDIGTTNAKDARAVLLLQAQHGASDVRAVLLR